MFVRLCVEPTGASADALDHMMVTNMSDQEALDDFLNSAAEDLSTGSSLTSGNYFPVSVPTYSVTCSVSPSLEGYVTMAAVCVLLWV